jgi:hypothetical protein
MLMAMNVMGVSPTFSSQAISLGASGVDDPDQQFDRRIV